MRDIRFRAWDKERKIMIQADDICRLHFSHSSLYGILTWDECMVMKFELMQFTGLHDKNGKEIWEGDICNSYYLTDEGDAWEIHKVIWDIQGACFRMPAYDGNYIFEDYDLNKVEVIGNIYENPELLKEKP